MSDIVSLLDRLAKFESAAKRLPQNLCHKRVSRPQLDSTFRLTQDELVKALGAKRPAALSENERQAVLVVARIHKGVDSMSVVASKAGVLVKRIRAKHGIVPVSAPKVPAFANADGPDRETDAERFTRLAAQAERRELFADCAEIQPQCWELACKLAKREDCPMLPSGFKSLGLEDLRALHKRLVETRMNWNLRLEEQQRTEEAARQAEEIRQAALKPLYQDAQRELDKLEQLIVEKRVRVERITLPPMAKLDAPTLEHIIKKLKGFKMTIENRARELDPRRSGRRVSNPSALRSPLAA